MSIELKSELAEITSKLCPPSYEPSEVALLKAHIRFFWEEYSHDLCGLMFFAEHHLKNDEEKAKVSEKDVSFYTKWAQESLPSIKEDIANTEDKGLDFWLTPRANQMKLSISNESI